MTPAARDLIASSFSTGGGASSLRSTNSHRATAGTPAGCVIFRRPPRHCRGLIQVSYRVLDLLRERGVVVAGQMQRLSERDSHSTGPRHSRGVMQHLVEPDDTHGYNGNIQTRRDHSDARHEAIDLARIRSLAFGKDQDRPVVRDEIADVLQRLPRAGLALR